MATNALDGYWGPVDSNNQWFEDRHTYSPYISEFWNTFSSFIFVIDGVRGFWNCRKFGMHFRYQAPYIMLIITGLGSVAFHATSRWWAEILDEVPMILLMFTFTYLARQHLPEVQDWVYHSVNIGATTCILGAYLYFHNYAIFLFGFSMYVIFLITVFSVDTKRSAYASEIGNWVFFPILLGKAIWELEQRLQIWWLHAGWHLLASIAAMHSIKMLIIFQCEHFGVEYVCSKVPRGGFDEILEAFALAPKSSTTTK